ncbi:MAG TPA: vWA domain-containing protein [Polyangiaceae bacterium]|jgi:hypothetical protein|nr:vWA domain-containing protein [Polyangiaceae bacterium]
MKWTLGALGCLALACSSSTNDGPAGGSGSTSSSGSATGQGNSGTIFGSGGSGTGSTSGIGSGSAPSLTADGGLDALRMSACAADTARTEPLPSVLELVIDTSGSMNDRAPGTNQSKWNVTHDALKSALDSLTANTGVGVLYFPDKNTTASQPSGTGTDTPRPPTDCVNLNAQIAIDLLGATGTQHRTQVSTSLDTIMGPAGGTPTHDAFHAGVGAIEATKLPGSRFIVLITDGQPTFLSGCRGTGNVTQPQDPTPILDDVKAAMAQGVRTFVIGSPGSEEVGVPIYSDAREWLSMAASLGGTALPGCSDKGPNFCHFDMTKTTNFSQALKDVLSQIVGTVLSCSYTLPTPTGGGTLDKTKVNVVFTPKGGKSQLIEQSPSATCTDGWRYSDDGNHVELCSNTCKTVQASDGPEVDVLFGCATQTGPVR